MTNAQDLLFDVQINDNPANTNSEYSKIVTATIPMPDGIHGCEEVKPLNYCSPRFNLLKNENVFPVIEKMLDDAKCEYVRAYKMNDDMTTFHAQYIIKTYKGNDVGIDVGGYGDNIYPTAIVDNSYNGQLQGALTFGYFRMICSNGIVIPLEGHEEKNFMIKGKHTQKLSFSFEQLLQKLNYFLGEQENLLKRFEVMTDRIVPTFEERVVEVLTATSIAASKDQFRAISDIIRNEAKTLGTSVNDFLIYNAINGHIFKGVDSKGNKSKALPEVKRKDDKKVLKYMMAN